MITKEGWFVDEVPTDEKLCWVTMDCIYGLDVVPVYYNLEHQRWIGALYPVIAWQPLNRPKPYTK